MLRVDDDVQGFAVYTEFDKPGQAFQFLVTPDAYANDGSLVPLAVHRRTVTPMTRKKQWKSTMITTDKIKQYLDSPTMYVSSAELTSFTEERMRHTLVLFDQLLNSGWRVREKPMLVEFSRYDADDVKDSITPSKVLYRVLQCRLALGMPKEII